MRIAIALVLLVASVHTLGESNKLVVHEWGTFTSLQDESGRSLAGLNADDERLPAFVSSIPISNEQSAMFSKGVPRLHPQVTMRLETPVVYFYPPQGATLPLDVTFTAKFNGGLLTQFFPKAEVSKIERTPKNLVRIEPNSAGMLTWRNVKVGTQGKLMETKDRVWTAPREVQAATLTGADGQSEKFLFYRGVGNLNAPLVVTRDKDKLHVALASEVVANRNYWPDNEGMYLVQIRKDGAVAFRRFRQGDGENLKPEFTTAATFNDMDFTFDPHNGQRLRDQMRASLTSAGLNEDEAKAMLNTWEQSYFKSPGMRLFFLVPPAWTKAVLPISVSDPNAQITRVMVARIEIVTPEQRQAVKKIAKAKDFKDKAVSEAYGSLGRFRDALLLDAAKTSPEFATFLSTNGIRFAEKSDQPPMSAVPLIVPLSLGPDALSD